MRTRSKLPPWALALLAGVLLLATGISSPAADQAASGAGGSVNPFYGSFATEVPIAVPEFHGIEPKLKLVYNSTGGNSFAGVGWNLSGHSSIQRAANGGGIPAYNTSDIYYLDGQKLIPQCTSQGGTHCTEIQNYTRITFNDHGDTDYANDTWEIWGTNGSHLRYEPLNRTTNDSTDSTYNWLLTSAEDANGNTINYHYTPAKNAGGLTQTVYLNSITYNHNPDLNKDMVEITFYRETRPDVLSASNGAYIAKLDQRLRSIAVRVYTPDTNKYTLVRAYTIDHTLGPSTGRSLVSAVTQWGNDAVLDPATGVVTNPTTATSLPAMTFAYQAGHTPGFTVKTGIHASASGPAIVGVQVGDVNGDGRSDIVANTDAGTFTVYISDAAGGTEKQTTYADPPEGLATVIETVLGDVNGDGRADLIMRHSDFMIHVALGTKEGGFKKSQAFKSYGYAEKGYFAVADVNGDGRTDVVTWYADTTVDGVFYDGRIMVNLAQKSGAPFATTPIQTDVSAEKNLLQLADLDGDGRADAMVQGLTSGRVNTYRANSDGTFSTEALAGTSVPGGVTYGAMLTNINGDGAADLISYNPDDGMAKVALGIGDGTFATNSVQTTFIDKEISFADINNDGRLDLVHYADGAVNFRISNGDGTYSVGETTTGPGGVAFGDLDGDGRQDMVKYTNSGNIYQYLAKGEGTPDLMKLMQNGIGGETAISYTPSSAWENTFLPSGMVVQTASQLTTTDGRGTSAPVNYRYGGGLWSTTERRFLGFRKVSAVISEQGDYTETYYFQQIGSISKPEFTYFKDNRGRLYRYSKFEYRSEDDTPLQPPYSSVMTARWEYECNLTDTCRRSLMQFSYDQYSNVIASYEYGDFDRQGDERTTVRGYYPNTGKYILGLPTYENTYEGLGTEGRMIEQALFFYDQATLLMSQPTKGNLTMVRKWNDQSGDYSQVRMEYDAYGNIIRKWDERDRMTTITYDPIHHLFPEQECKVPSSGDSLCTTSNWGNYVMGQKAWEQDPNGAKAEYGFDPIGRPVSLTAPDDPSNPKPTTRRETRYQHFTRRQSNTDCTVASGVNCVRKVLPNGTWEEEYVDGLGRKYLAMNSGGTRQETVYDSTASRVSRESLPYDAATETPVWIVTTYDGAGRVRRVYNPDPTPDDLSDQSYGETIYGMDGEGEPYVATYDEVGNEKVSWRNLYGNLTQVREKNGEEYYYTTYEYDLKGRLCRLRDHLGNISTFTWDSLGRKLTSTTPELGLWRYTYHKDGALDTQTDNKGNTTTLTYDPFGRVKTKGVSGSATPTTYYYDETGHGAALGRLTRITHPAGSSSLVYDLLGRETMSTRCVEGACKGLRQSYDDLGRIATVTYPTEFGGSQDLVRYGYDSVGRLHALTLESVAGGEPQPLVREMLWTADGRLDLMRYGNDTVTDFEYDPNRRWLSSATVKNATNNATLYQAGYQYYQNGLVATMSSATDTLPPANVSYRYDGVKRLTKVAGTQAQEYRYDAIGNRLYAHEENPELVDPVTTNFRYDKNGNLEEEKDPTGMTLRTFTWDAENRLSKAVKGNVTATYLYDQDGERIKKVVTEAGGATTTTHYFGPLVETRNGVLVKYYYAGGILVAKRVGKTGAPFYYHADRLGSTKLITDAAGTTATGNSYDFTAFGRTAAKSGSVANERGFTGQREDPEVGLIYMGARYYDPATGRFISPDTIVPDPANPQSLNRYAYCLNNPISYVDPSGHVPVVVAVVSAIVTVVAESVPVWVAATAVVGAGMTALGYFTDNPVLSTIGAVMLGFAGGYCLPTGAGIGALSGMSSGIVGASVSLAISPLSPLDPGVKQAIGWAYMAYGMYKAFSESMYADSAGGEATAELNPCDLDVPVTFERGMEYVRQMAKETSTLQRYYKAFNQNLADMMPGGKNAARIIVERGVTGHWWVNSGKPTFGIYNWFTNTIHLHEGAFKSLKEFADTYFHELAHYANDIAKFVGYLNPPAEAWWPSVSNIDTKDLIDDGIYGYTAEQISRIR